ncbi:coiled-coil domain-containing protein 18-like [Arapaima gigas]
MEERDTLADISSLLLQLATESQDISLKKLEADCQIQIFQGNVAEKKIEIENTRKSIENLEEHLSQREKLLTHYKDSVRSLKETNQLLLQYEQTLQQELHRRQESYSQDRKMYEERIENYRKVFEEQKEQYFKSPLAQKLIQLQQEKAEIEQRIMGCEERIVSKEKELQALQGMDLFPGSVSLVLQKLFKVRINIESFCCDSSDPGPDTMAESEAGSSSEAEEVRDIAETLSTREDHYADTMIGITAIPSVVDTWSRVDTSAMLIHSAGVLQDSQIEAAQQRDSAAVEQQQKDTVGGEQESQSHSKGHTEDTAGYLRTPPPRMKAVSDTPTFSLSGSTCPSPGYYDAPESFVFSAHLDPNTPGFSGFGFSAEPVPEDTSFSFSASSFTHKVGRLAFFVALLSTVYVWVPIKRFSLFLQHRKLWDPKKQLPGFMFEQMDSHPEEQFSLFSKSPGPRSSGSEQGTLSETSPFSFSFGKFQ